MPFARSPVLARSDSSQKKQQSISSFFTTRASATPKPQSQQTPTLGESNGLANSSHRDTNHEENALFVNSEDDATPRKPQSWKLKRSSEEANHNETPLKKRRKQATDEDLDGDGEDNFRNVSQPNNRTYLEQTSATQPNGTRKPKLSERTSKYLFSSSPIGDENNAEPDDEDARRVKEGLHRKFVKKLGKPDSIAEIKRRNNFISEETTAGDEDAQEEDADDEEPAAKPTTKGKKGPAAKKGSKKLTPMEQQILDLKSKCRDTLLVVEVGYKFRFFGEDARIAAKELGIVCIPGKFRFDERESWMQVSRSSLLTFR